MVVGVGVPIAMFLPDGSVAFRTDAPFGGEVAPLLAAEEFRRVLATKAPVVGNLYHEPRPVVPLMVPVIWGGKIVAVLGSRIPIDFLAQVLGAVQPADVEFTSVVDGNGRVMAVEPEKPNAAMLGRRVRDWQLQAIHNNPNGGSAQGTSLLGVPVIAAIHPIPTSPGWVVTVAAPENVYTALQRRSLFWMTLGSVVVYLFSLAAALYLAHRLVQPVAALTRHAERVAGHSPAQRATLKQKEHAIPSPVAEIETLRQAIIRASDVQALLTREVDHRAKNLLAVVQSVMKMSRADTIEEFVAAVSERVNALARVHSLLAQEGWDGAGPLAVAERELAAYAGRVTLHGPPVSLVSTAVQPVSMLLHELSTSAVKYGALSTPEGRVEVTWLLETAGEALHLCWREKGGPPIMQPPTRRGFGTRVIDATAAQLGGSVRRQWQSSGLLCDVRLPMQRVLRCDEHEYDARTAEAPLTAAAG